MDAKELGRKVTYIGIDTQGLETGMTCVIARIHNGLGTVDLQRRFGDCVVTYVGVPQDKIMRYCLEPEQVAA